MFLASPTQETSGTLLNSSDPLVLLGLMKQYPELECCVYGRLFEVVKFNKQSIQYLDVSHLFGNETKVRLRSEVTFKEVSWWVGTKGHRKGGPAMINLTNGNLEFTHSGWTICYLLPHKTNNMSGMATPEARIIEEWLKLNNKTEMYPLTIR